MAMLRWLQPRNSLPDRCRPQAIATANQEVEEAIHTASSGKHEAIQYIVWAEIGKYA